MVDRFPLSSTASSYYSRSLARVPLARIYGRMCSSRHITSNEPIIILPQTRRLRFMLPRFYLYFDKRAFAWLTHYLAIISNDWTRGGPRNRRRLCSSSSNLQIHAVRANFHIMFSVRSTAMGRAGATGSAHLQQTATFSPDSEPVGGNQQLLLLLLLPRQKQSASGHRTQLGGGGGDS